MSSCPDRRSGFSLVELMVALAIGSVVVSAMMIATTFASRRQMTILRDVSMVGQGVLSIEALRGSLRSASYIVAPASAAQSDFLAGYVNADESAGFAPVLPGRPREYFYFCVDAGPPRRFYRYTGPLGSPPDPMPAIVCGQAGGESLAGDPLNRMTPAFRFSRAADASNVISVDYVLTYRAAPADEPQVLRGRTAIQTQAPRL